MKKISTLFKKDPANLGRVINEVNLENAWAIENGIATRKFDGTATAIINGELYKRYDVKKGRNIPANAIPCQGPDEITGHHPHWVKCSRDDKSDQYHFEAFDKLVAADTADDGTYELIGPKVQGNPESLENHGLFKHGAYTYPLPDRTFDGIREFLSVNNIEGIVFHENGGERMCKIRKSDFGIKR